jgi:hypothetical protein
MPSVLEGGDLRQADEAVVGCGVGRGVGEADEAEDGRHIDDRTAATFEHPGDLVLHAQKAPVRLMPSTLFQVSSG